jgi:hypothetical protein
MQPLRATLATTLAQLMWGVDVGVDVGNSSSLQSQAHAAAGPAGRIIAVQRGSGGDANGGGCFGGRADGGGGGGDSSCSGSEFSCSGAGGGGGGGGSSSIGGGSGSEHNAIDAHRVLLGFDDLDAPAYGSWQPSIKHLLPPRHSALRPPPLSSASTNDAAVGPIPPPPAAPPAPALLTRGQRLLRAWGIGNGGAASAVAPSAPAAPSAAALPPVAAAAGWVAGRSPLPVANAAAVPRAAAGLQLLLSGRQSSGGAAAAVTAATAAALAATVPRAAAQENDAPRQPLVRETSWRPSNSEEPHWRALERQYFVLLTYGLLVSMTVVAVAAPNIGVALSVIGDLAGTVQAFIVPGAILFALAAAADRSQSGHAQRDAAGCSGSGGGVGPRSRFVQAAAGAAVLCLGSALLINGILRRVL